MNDRHRDAGFAIDPTDHALAQARAYPREPGGVPVARTAVARHPATSPHARSRWLAWWMLVILTAITLSGVARAQAVPGVHVRGTGVVFGEPDVVLLTIGVDITDPSVTVALEHADETMQAAREAALALGIAARDVRTASFQVWREDLWDQDGTLTGARYHVQHGYQVTVRDVARVGAVLAAMIEAGANQVGGIEYTLADPVELERQARALAMADAERKAGELAALAGGTLGAPYAIEESAATDGAPVQYAMREGLGGGAVSAGQLAVRIDVSVDYRLE